MNTGNRLAKAKHLIDSGKPNSAIPVLQNLVAEDPDDPEVRYHLALAYLSTAKYALALEELAIVVDKQPDKPHGYTLIGECMRNLSRQGEAIANYNFALTKDRDYAPALACLGQFLYLYLGEIQRPIELLERAIKIEPSNAVAHMSLALALFSDGQNDAAIKHAKKALRLNPEEPSHYIRFAHIYQLMGNKAESNRLLEKVQSLSGPKGSTYFFMAETYRFTRDNLSIIHNMEKLLDEPMPVVERDTLHYALGKAYDDIGDWDHAFDHYRRGSSLVRAQKYNVRDHQKQLKMMMSFFKRMYFGKQSDDYSSESPIFIIGMPRSGSTLLERMLCMHPNVHSIGESFLFQEVLGGWIADRGSFPACLKEATVEDYQLIAEQYLSQARQGVGIDSRIIDKQLFYFHNLGMISLIFPHARILHIRRNPLDTCLSCFFQRFQSEGILGWSFDLQSTGAFYRQYLRFIDYWKHCLITPILEVDYEQLVTDPEGESRRIFEYCDLQWSPEVLSFYKREATVQTASHDQVRQPIYTRSVARWVNYAKHLQPLIDGLGITHISESDRKILKEAGIRYPNRLFNWLN